MYTEKTGLACIYMKNSPTQCSGSMSPPSGLNLQYPHDKKLVRNRAYLKSICLLCLLYSVMLNVLDWQAASGKRVMKTII